MARDVGKVSTFVLKKEIGRKGEFRNSKDNPKDHDLGDDIHVHKSSYRNTTIYHTNDHKSRQTLHISEIKHNKPTKELPFEHIKQDRTERAKTDRLPKKYAQDFIYNHFKSQKHPLVSSESQFHAGHHMWRQLAHRALKDKKHVYYHDGEKLHKSNASNIDHHLDSSFGEGKGFEHKHMIISHHKL